MARRSRIARLTATVITLPITLAVVLFAVSNRQSVDLHFWPLPGSFDVPLYVIGLGTMVFGFLVGGITAWIGAGEARHRARVAERDARSLEARLTDVRAENDRIRAALPPSEAAAD